MDEREAFSLGPTRQLRRRKAVNRVMELLMVTAALLAVAALVLVVLAVVSRGYKAISWDFFTQPPATGFFDSGGGIANAIVGTLLLVALGAAMAVPVGVLGALYLTEFARPRVALALQMM
ncbi:MAG: phosphate ABC transporter permease PtsA, partial [Gaiellaceae bacterium]